MTIKKIALPNEYPSNELPVAQGRWGFKENLADLKPHRFAGDYDLLDGVLSFDSTLTIYYPFLPGHLYRLNGSVTGSLELAVGGTVTTWGEGDNSVAFKATSGAKMGEIAFFAHEPSKVRNLTLTLCQSPDFLLAHTN